MKIDLNTSLKNNIHENSLTKTMKTYYITESAIIKRVYSVKAHSVEEAKEKFNKEGGDYLPPTDESEDVDGSHQIEEVEFIEEVEEWKLKQTHQLH